MGDRKICFVSPKIYPLLKNRAKEFMGGAELQQAVIGKYIHGKGYEVCYISRIYENSLFDEIVDGIKVYKICNEEEGIPVFRFIYPRMTSLWKALKKADCDIYYQRGAAAMTGMIAMYCKIYGKKFVFSGANDSNFSPEVKGVKYTRDKIIYKWGLRNSTYIIVQSEKQRRLLKKNFGLDGNVIYNVYTPKKITKDKKYILWVANIKPQKRPELFFELANGIPEIEFVMIGGRVAGFERLYDKIVEKAKGIENLNFLGFQPLKFTEQKFDGASVFVNTSEKNREGFPNTFLQAWSRGIPTISFFDIDNIIQNNKLGSVINDVNEGVERVRQFLGYGVELRNNIQGYFVENHLPEKYLQKLNGILTSRP